MQSKARARSRPEHLGDKNHGTRPRIKAWATPPQLRLYSIDGQGVPGANLQGSMRLPQSDGRT